MNNPMIARHLGGVDEMIVQEAAERCFKGARITDVLDQIVNDKTLGVTARDKAIIARIAEIKRDGDLAFTISHRIQGAIKNMVQLRQKRNDQALLELTNDAIKEITRRHYDKPRMEQNYGEINLPIMGRLWSILDELKAIKSELEGRE